MRNRATTRLKLNYLRSPKIRQSWSKYNLYNLERIRDVNKFLNFFKTKWQSKSMSRSYHGEQIREKQWVRMFDRRIRSVIPMDAQYLASNDGSVESAGRGSGLDIRDTPRTKRSRAQKKEVPYMQMTYAPLERRLDTAIFRAMFASSARQARQFVIHGAVKVNGKQIRYPGYLLNPGDMFQVLPERVMFATGAPKVIEKAKAAEQEGEGEDAASEVAAEEVEKQAELEEEAEVEQDPREVLKALKAQAKSILTSAKQDLGGKRKQELRAFSRAIRRLLSKSKSTTKSTALETGSAEAQLAEIQEALQIRRENKAAGTSSPPSAQTKVATSAESADATSVAEEEPKASTEQPSLNDTEYNELLSALRSMQENPVDDSKPYATPWMPRDFMSVFAFIPRFLEVNHKICAAVYLRHPVARPGLAEVPTPFTESINSNAFTWYLRRG
ncbi:hypothetical protein LTR47_002612 [Exophiala xenobiotica]|nr:hypothetical protein LTR47_002612 [Exophiala xenobiotica]KAK5251282.1 hypothetical protein LTS06_004039 [Exophiala xenobiotica]KAK5350767.1 hypothetical protein LTR61_005965 [Exophiala xenobiotica]KAK5377818.1 hypothetical protein LTS03_004693 [Exophiala xenobiotica]KAK5389235.1 hypothetical protein LTR11_000044 [Exophiala xenobiotica]